MNEHSCIHAAYGTVTHYKSPGGLSIRRVRTDCGGQKNIKLRLIYDP